MAASSLCLPIGNITGFSLVIFWDHEIVKPFDEPLCYFSWILIELYPICWFSLDWKDGVCQTVNMYFVCLCVCLSVCLLPVFKTMVESVVGWLRVTVFITSDQAESLFLAWLIAVAPFSLLLARRSSAVTHLPSLLLCLSRIWFWNLNPSLGWSLILFQWVKDATSCLWLASCVFT